jgi:hypothetical protein
MAIIGTYSVNNDPNTLSNLYDNVDELLLGLPNNNQNLIKAENIRDAVYTLYEYTNAIVASSSATASLVYDRPNPSTYIGNVGGINQGSTFSGSIQDALDRVFYPYVAPSSSLNVSSTPREFGSSLSVTLNWSVVKNSNPITTIIVDGQPFLPTGDNQTGTKSTLGTYSLTPSISQTNTFTMNVSDGTSSVSSSTNLVWMNRVYWGRVDLSSIGNPNLTYNPGSFSLVGSICNDSNILSLDGADANGNAFGSILSTTKNRTYNGIDGGGQYLIFAWPSVLPGATAPSFTVNGLPNTAFTRVRTISPFVNSFVFTTNYEVWVSNTLQNSPLNIVIS